MTLFRSVFHRAPTAPERRDITSTSAEPDNTILNLSNSSLEAETLAAIISTMSEPDRNAIVHLHLAGNGLESLPDEVSWLPNVVSINLDRNRFKTLPVVVSSLRNLLGLSIRGNPLTNRQLIIPADMAHVQEINVDSGVSISRISATVAHHVAPTAHRPVSPPPVAQIYIPRFTTDDKSQRQYAFLDQPRPDGVSDGVWRDIRHKLHSTSFVLPKQSTPAEIAAIFRAMKPDFKAQILKLGFMNIGLTEVPDLTGFVNLELLSLWNNKLKTVPDLRYLTRLKMLYLKGNRLIHAPARELLPSDQTEVCVDDDIPPAPRALTAPTTAPTLVATTISALKDTARTFVMLFSASTPFAATMPDTTRMSGDAIGKLLQQTVTKSKEIEQRIARLRYCIAQQAPAPTMGSSTTIVPETQEMILLQQAIQESTQNRALIDFLRDRLADKHGVKLLGAK
jgi:Leucine-rich repeat (LRR) protein